MPIRNPRYSPPPHASMTCQAALPPVESRLSSKWKSPSLCSTVIDGTGKFVETSDGFCKLLGYSHQELISMTYEDLTAPGSADTARVLELFTKCGYMHGLWLLMSRSGTRILVRYESWVRPDLLIQTHLELVGAGY